MALHQQLVDFDEPPVTEVALSVMFESLKGFSSAYAGRLWAEFAAEFPKTEDHPDLELAIEEPSAPADPSLPKIQWNERPRVRVWFTSEDGTRLLQVQHNRFVFNWRRETTDVPYPRYEDLRASFSEAYERFVRFVADQQLGEIHPIQCEITYVNRIEVEGPWSHACVGKVLSIWRDLPDSGFLPAIEDARFLIRFVIPDGAGAMRGRLLVTLQPAYVKSTRKEILSLTLVARGKPTSANATGICEFLDIGHEWIVRGFADLTTEEMHKKWGRTR